MKSLLISLLTFFTMASFASSTIETDIIGPDILHVTITGKAAKDLFTLASMRHKVSAGSVMADGYICYKKKSTYYCNYLLDDTFKAYPDSEMNPFPRVGGRN